MVILAAAISGQFVGGDWYQAVNQPSWNPSAPVMALAWALLYVCMGIAAWLVWNARGRSASIAIGWWVFQLLLGVVWSLVFFGLQRVGWALAVMSLWLLVSLIVVNAFRFVRMEAALLMTAVAGWLIFNWILNFFQWHLNGGGSG